MTTINRYNKFPEYFGDNTIDLDGDTFKIALMNSSHTFTATNTIWANVSANELSTANGYTSPGQNMTTTWVESAGTVTFDATNIQWTASGGSIVATDAVIYSDTASSDELAYSIDFEGTETAGDGTPFNVNFNASGIFTI